MAANIQSQVQMAMNELVAGLPTKAAKIRALGAAGYTRSEIAKFLGIRYQHVRNVLVQPLQADAKRSEAVEDAADRKAEMDGIASGLETKSAKIRALDEAGYSRSEIAKYLDIRYQHVRNVLVQPATAIPEQVVTRLAPGGRVVIPAQYRKALHLDEGDRVLICLENEEIRITSLMAPIRHAQEIVRRHVPEGVSLSEELINERRLESQRES
ncbi:MAG: AbrB/MazE/SpoVT family DNA-binding domain-containing protein [Kiloniellales bacterium]|nr:AbrB/MazE/SpoVT family DNA-binding domain-containing protein [Kiloniellales bacterium]